METLTPKHLKQEARQTLASASVNPRHLILLYTGVTVGLGLLVNGINILLNQQIGSTGGLGGLGMRSMLQTIQTLMSYFVTLFTPFWGAGLLFCFLGLVRQEEVVPRDMLSGFRRFGRILSFSLLTSLAALMLFLPVVYIASTIYMLTPLSAPFSNALDALIESGTLTVSGGLVDLSSIPPEVMLQGMLPITLILMAVAVPVFLWLSYSLSMGVYLIMSDQVRGGFQALFTSIRMTRGHKWKLFKLDLSYWWFYVLEGLATVVLYLDLIFTVMDIEAPFNPTVFFFLLLVLYSVLELALHLWKKAERDTVFVLAYEQIADDSRPGTELSA